jgi:DNA (cytosine-5)-methyltransferase 1
MPSLSLEYSRENGCVMRKLSCGDPTYSSSIEFNGSGDSSASAAWMESYLKGKPITHHANAARGSESLGIVDLFSGCGGFSLGALLAGQALGLAVEPLLAVDIDPMALEVYARNLEPESVLNESVSSLVDYQLWSENGKSTFARDPKVAPKLLSFVGRTGLVIGGPPCQGHSGFNNHTRSKDDRNPLYLTVPAIGIALKAEFIIVENVYNVVNDKFKVVHHATEILRSYGYTVASVKLVASDYGVAQARKRHFLVASKHGCPLSTGAFELFKTEEFSVGQAIGDLVNVSSSSAFDKPARLSAENVARVKHLFDNNSYRLPNHVRPDCHKDGHTYPSVYGRLNSDGVANTITTGFASPGRGRYVHPTQERALTAHEAARLQGFPDAFSFHDFAGRDLTNKAYGKLIGDAVPPPLGFVPAIAALLTRPSISIHEQGQTVGKAAEAQAA